jgi:hypothetical protein
LASQPAGICPEKTTVKAKKRGPAGPHRSLVGFVKSLSYFFFLPPFFVVFLAAFFFVAMTSPPSRQLIDSPMARC